MAQLQIEAVAKSFGGTTAVDHVDLDVGDGEFAVLLGPSGCGKTTLLRLVAGLERLDHGRIVLGGRDVSNVAPGDRDVAMVFQRYALYPNMTVFENIAFGLRARRLGKAEVIQRIDRVAAALEISDLLRRKPGTLSGGQRQRVALARAISREPQLFLMDEPLSSLDTKLRASMRAELKRLHQRLGATVLYVTHDQVEAMTMGSQVAVLRSGRVVQAGSPSDIYHRPTDEFVATFVGSPPMNLLEGVLVRDGDDRVAFDCGSTTVPLLRGEASGLRPEGRTRCRLGIRPENLVVRSARSVSRGGRWQFLGESVVDVAEPMGYETVLHLNFEGGQLLVRTSSEPVPEVGDRVVVEIDVERVRLFDVGTGAAMALGPEDGVPATMGAAS